jgi:hypothetical protein
MELDGPGWLGWSRVIKRTQAEAAARQKLGDFVAAQIAAVGQQE